MGRAQFVVMSALLVVNLRYQQMMCSLAAIIISTLAGRCGVC